ncbi:MAG: hypothetical protein JJT88_19625, partial [Gammaproteobacteria bacterium]|nr:hypothetical protein [Gammaproteobacteria bacterium]
PQAVVRVEASGQIVGRSGNRCPFNREDSVMRTLTATEVDQVSGGALNFAAAGIGAVGGGLVLGGQYALQSHMAGNFSWGAFSANVAHGTATGFLLGSGGTLIHAGITGTIKGATVAGASMLGAGAALGVAPSAGSGSSSGEGGGSD